MPVITAMALIAAGHGTVYGQAYQIVAAGALVAIVLATQLGYLEVRGERLMGALFSAWLLSVAIADAEKPVGWVGLAGALSTAVVSLFASPPGSGWRRYLAQRLKQRRAEPRPLSAASKTILWQVQIRALFIQRQASTVLTLVAAIGVGVGAGRLMTLQSFDVRALPTGIFALAAQALIMSGLFRTLHLVHRPMRPFLAALPVARRFWVWRDTTFILCLGVPPLVVTLHPLAAAGALGARQVIAVAVLYLVLVASLRWPRLRGGPHGVLLSAALAGFWAWPALVVTS